MQDFATLFLETMRYEHWLRFYFLDDAGSGGGPMQASAEKELSADEVLCIPDDIAERSRAEEPQFATLLDTLRGKNVSMERSRDAVFDCLGQLTGLRPGSSEFEKQLTALSGDESFRRQLDGFHGWVQELANNELDLQGNALPPDAPRDERIPSFTEWNRAFRFWFSLQKPLELQPMA